VWAWFVLTVSFWVGLWIANSWFDPKLTWKQILLVAAACTAVAFIPYVGQLLSIVVGIVLLCWMTDLGWKLSLLVMVLTRTIAILLAIGVFSFVAEREAEKRRVLTDTLLRAAEEYNAGGEDVQD